MPTPEQKVTERYRSINMEYWEGPRRLWLYGIHSQNNCTDQLSHEFMVAEMEEALRSKQYAFRGY